MSERLGEALTVQRGSQGGGGLWETRGQELQRGGQRGGALGAQGMGAAMPEALPASGSGPFPGTGLRPQAPSGSLRSVPTSRRRLLGSNPDVCCVDAPWPRLALVSVLEAEA